MHGTAAAAASVGTGLLCSLYLCPALCPAPATLPCPCALQAHQAENPIASAALLEVTGVLERYITCTPAALGMPGSQGYETRWGFSYLSCPVITTA